MLSADVVVAGGGAAGLLIASALAPTCSVLLVEQSDNLPRNKYWLTSEGAAHENPHLAHCIDRSYDDLDFVAYDGLTTTLAGRACLWDTDKLVNHLTQEILRGGARILTGCRLYSITPKRDAIMVRANAHVIRARLLVDCMGFGSPIVGAKAVARITGYYILHGCEVGLRHEVRPIALDNVIVNQHPTFFEVFPTSHRTAHVALILPSREHVPDRSLAAELAFILRESHYAEHFRPDDPCAKQTYFGIIPVGRLLRPALDRMVFFGEAGQTNPATSATGLTRMLHTYRALAMAIGECLQSNRLERKDLLRAMPLTMTRMNRRFQESIFERLLSFNSDDFRRLVQDLNAYPSDSVHAMIFADFGFRARQIVPLALRSLLRPGSILGPHLVRSMLRWCWWR